MTRLSARQVATPLHSATSLIPEQFEEKLHLDINKPTTNFRSRMVGPAKHRRLKTDHNNAHNATWANTTINLTTLSIDIKVSINFKQNSLTLAEYSKLKRLAIDGIKQYWSHPIKINRTSFNVSVHVIHENSNTTIPADLYIESGNDYARSMNPALLGIDASFTYNKGAQRGTIISAAGTSMPRADGDFKLVAAHEFGHSVLMYAGGISLSWGHKGSTNALLQSVKSSTPGYPTSGDIDLMKYYDYEKAWVPLTKRIRNSKAMEIDIKRLIWASKLTWIN